MYGIISREAGDRICAEMTRALREHRPLPVGHPERCLTILAREFGEVANEVNPGQEESLMAELAQVAATAILWIEGLNAVRDALNYQQSQQSQRPLPSSKEDSCRPSR